MLFNITILSLGISDLYSLSPLFVGNNLHLQNSLFSKYFSTIFYNSQYLLLQNDQFRTAVGSPILTDIDNLFLPIYTNSVQNVQTLINKTFDLIPPTIFSNISYIGIQNCIFANLSGCSYALSIQGRYTFYMTSCLFKSCSCQTSVLCLKSQAMSISHICSFNSNGVKYKFMNTDVPDNSFLEFVYSTIHEDNLLPTNAEYVNYLKNGAIREQCINISNIKTNGGIEYYGQPQCLSCLMNTIYQTKSAHVCKFNPRFNTSYMERNNYVENTFTRCLMFFDLQSGIGLFFDHCAFSKNTPQTQLWNGIQPNVIYFYDCYFTNNDDFPSGLVGRNNVTFTEVVITNENYQYVTGNYCPGTPASQAFACDNGTCPEGKGCPKDKFDFNTGEFEYTKVHQEDLNTPSASAAPTETTSYAFTGSETFLSTKEFSTSSIFTNSDLFSSSLHFTLSQQFSSSNSFSNSNIFSSSHGFSGSTVFSASADFSNSITFSSSVGFSASSMFSSTNLFSESITFSSSSKFTNSDTFSKSGPFSRSKIFSFSFSFTQSSSFTISQSFTNTEQFTHSDIFTQSANFAMTNSFDPTLLFSKSKSFSQSFIQPKLDVNDGGSSGLTPEQKKIIAIVAGSVGIAGVLGGVIAGVVLAVRHSAVIPAIEANVVPETGASPPNIQTNPLHNMYEENDPFNHDFD